MRFRALFSDLRRYTDAYAYANILSLDQQMAQDEMGALSAFGDPQMMTKDMGGTYESYEWYALSRVNDLLLMNFQPEVAWFDWRQKSYITKYPALSVAEYRAFFDELGMHEAIQSSFHPFYHEIIEVEQCQNLTDVPEITRVLWPCLMYGSMLFSRAGVVVRAGAAYINKAIAERSQLYFTYARKYRPTHDQSHGWGSNSQWATTFRRDYVTDDAFYYNVDAVYADDPLDLASDQNHHFAEDPSKIDLSLSSRIELLRHRCFVTTIGQDDDEYPYDDYYVEQKQPTASNS